MPTPPPSEEGTFTFSSLLRFPKLLDEGRLPRVYMEWRGLKLANPPELEDIGEHKTVPISRKWREGQAVFFRLMHPEKDRSCDFNLLRIGRGEEGNVAVLRIAEGWPDDSESRCLVLVKVVDSEHVRTLDLGEFLRALQNLNSTPFESEDPDGMFGTIADVNSAEFRSIEKTSRRLSEEGVKLHCFFCEEKTEISQDDAVCPKCGESLNAPDCPLCGKPVCLERSVRIFYGFENGRYPWHYSWDEKCQNCHHQFSSKMIVKSGHHVFFSGEDYEELIKTCQDGDPFAGKSTIEITAAESVREDFDDWDYRPTIRISISRKQGANRSEGGLMKQESISLTPQEFEAIKNELEGPLSVLLKRKAWNRDTT